MEGHTSHMSAGDTLESHISHKSAGDTMEDHALDKSAEGTMRGHTSAKSAGCTMEGHTSDKSPGDTVEGHTSEHVSPPQGVSSRMWEKFQTLQKRRQQISQRSTERRKRTLQREVLAKVQQEFRTQEEVDILLQHNVQLTGEPANKKSLPTSNLNKGACPAEGQGALGSSAATNEEQWTDIKGYLDCNKHLQGLEHGRHAPQTALEKKIDSAVQLGDWECADRLSDHLAARQFGEKVTAALDAKTYDEHKKLDEEVKKSKKKKRLAWGFDHKERWETKGNM